MAVRNGVREVLTGATRPSYTKPMTAREAERNAEVGCRQAFRLRQAFHLRQGFHLRQAYGGRDGGQDGGQDGGHVGGEACPGYTKPVRAGRGAVGLKLSAFPDGFLGDFTLSSSRRRQSLLQKKA